VPLKNHLQHHKSLVVEDSSKALVKDCEASMQSKFHGETGVVFCC
jgi:hypothetical protein